MTTPSRKPQRSPSPSRRGRRPWPWVVVAVLTLVAVGVFLWKPWAGRGPTPSEFSDLQPLLDEVGGDRSVVLVFPNWDATGYVTEQRQLPRQRHLEGDLMTVMVALCEGPQISGAVASLPEGTRPLAAFYNETEGSIVLDFSRELVTAHPGGSASEAGTLTSILRTIALNFPEVQSCTLLVAGAQTETLAGHLNMDKPFQLQRWL